MSKFGLQGKITALPGRRDELVAVLLESAEVLKRQAPGCLLYIVSTLAKEPDTVLVTEAWESREDHQASLSLEDVKSLLMRGRPLIASFEGTETEPLGGKGL